MNFYILTLKKKVKWDLVLFGIRYLYHHAQCTYQISFQVIHVYIHNYKKITTRFEVFPTHLKDFDTVQKNPQGPLGRSDTQYGVSDRACV